MLQKSSKDSKKRKIVLMKSKRSLSDLEKSKSVSETAKTQSTVSQKDSGGAECSPISARSFDSVVKEIKAAKPQKRGPGRPPKTAGASSAADQSQTGLFGSTQASSQNQNQGQTQSPGVVGVEGASSNCSPTIPVSACKLYLTKPFDYAAKRTGFQGFKLEDQESDELAAQLPPIIAQYMPMLNTPHAPLIIFSVSLLGVAGMKYLSYRDWLEAEKLKVKAVQT